MIQRDIRYIIKKILIGIGIIVGISFIRSCNVYALEDTSNMEPIIVNYNHPNNFVFNIWYDRDNEKIYATRKDSFNTTKEQFFNIPDDYKYLLYVKSSTSSNWSSPLYLLNTTWDYKVISGTKYISCSSAPCSKIQFGWNINRNSNTILDLTTYNYTTIDGSNWSFNAWDGNNSILNTNFDIYYQNSDNIYKTKSIDVDIGLLPPTIVSLNPTLNKTEDNMLVSVSFAPQFDYIDTENYNYYAWFEGYDKFLITENNTTFNTQNNTTFYVEIRDKEDNYITSQTYTVSSIGLVYNGDYDIQFTTDEYSQSDTENSTDEIFDTINRIDINILYIPKWVNYKYQYQYVPENSSLTDNWVLVNENNDKNNVVYTAGLNGTMYARILDENNNVLKSETFTITRIGQIKTYDKNQDKFYGMFNIIKEKLHFGGPISDLIVIPVNVLQSISNASNKVCTPYNLGSIAGYHIVLPCIEPEHYLGSALWTTIDLIFSGCMFFAISKWFTSAYYNFILLDNTPGIKGRRDLK